MTSQTDPTEMHLERLSQRVVFAVGIGSTPLCVFSVTSGDDHDAGDELAFYGVDMLGDAIEDALEVSLEPGIYVWEGALRSSGELVKGPEAGERPLMRWYGSVRLALPEEVLAINGDHVPSPAPSDDSAV